MAVVHRQCDGLGGYSVVLFGTSSVDMSPESPSNSCVSGFRSDVVREMK